MNFTTSTTASYNTQISFVSTKDAENLLDFEGKAGKSTTRYEDGKRVLYIGTGEEKLTSTELRNAVANATRQLNSLKVESVSISLDSPEATSAVVEGCILGDYSFDIYKSEKPTHISEVELVNGDVDAITKAEAVASGVCKSRDLVNENADIVTPEFLATEAQKIADSSDKISLEILTEKEITEKGLGLLWAVGKGSATPPRLIIINYKGDTSSDETTSLVGKGVTFDTGGLNLKPSGSIEAMRSDMSGAAAVLGIMQTLVALDAKINIVGVVTSAQNAISNTAYFPGDIITGYNGTTVEVLNTDAEGRLCLADAISYVKENYSPDRIINMATLTGAVIIALGDTIAGLFSNNEELKDELYNAGEESGENLWELPIRKEHHEAMKSSIADLQNISKKARNASSITAGAFLQHFVGETPWCHLDIAGTSWNKTEANGVTPKFATGFGVRLILNYLLK